MDIKLLKQLNKSIPNDFEFEKKWVWILKNGLMGLYITFEGDSISYFDREWYTISIKNKMEFDSVLFFAQLKEVLSENTKEIDEEIKRVKEQKRMELKEKLSLLED